MQTKLKDTMFEISSHNVVLPNGDKLIIEVNGQGDNSYIVSTCLIPKRDEEAKIRQYCGYCNGKLIGCVTCPGPDVTLNCIDETIKCG
jgi:hypothetical protein